jgi:hypothetical protein
MRWTPLFVLLVACSTTPPQVKLTPQAANVRTGKDDPPAELVEAGPVEATHGSGCGGFGKVGTYEGAYTLLRNKAASLGATYVRITTITEPHPEGDCYSDAFVIRGIAYRPA